MGKVGYFHLFIISYFVILYVILYVHYSWDGLIISIVYAIHAILIHVAHLIIAVVVVVVVVVRLGMSKHNQAHISCQQSS
jgi:hypothetical protein